MVERVEIRETDLLRAYAIIGVILIHVASPGLNQFTADKSAFWVASVWDAYARASVPIFFMITGYIFLSRTDSISEILKKTLSRIIIPLVFWSVIYIIFSWQYHKTPISVSSFTKILEGPVYFHLWYLYAAVFIYLSLPILQKIKDAKTSIYFISIWFTLFSIIPTLKKLNIIHASLEHYYTFFSGYIGYIFLGKLIGNIEGSRRKLTTSLLLSLSTPLLIALSTYLISLKKDSIDVFFQGYTRPLTVLYACAMFSALIFTHRLYKQNIPLQKQIKSISDCSFGIYLIHIIIYRLIEISPSWISKITSIKTSSGILTKAAIIFITSWILVLVLKKIPLIKKVI